MPLLGLEEMARTYRAPVIGDHVISHHQRWAFFGATIASFDRETMSYTVNWDDGDPSGRVQSYKVHRKYGWCLLYWDEFFEERLSLSRAKFFEA